MSKVQPIFVPHENVNDETVRILSWLVSSGQRVDKGQPLAELETSKTNVEIYAPEAGIIEYSTGVGDEIRIGAELCFIHLDESGPTAPSAVPMNGVEAKSEPPIAFPDASTAPPPAEVGNPSLAIANGLPAARFSDRALELLRKHALQPEQFAGRGLVRTHDVLVYLGQSPAHSQPVRDPQPVVGQPMPPNVSPTPAVGVPYRTEELSRAKRMEIKYLSSACRNTLPSQVSVLVPTRGFRTYAARNAQIHGNATAIIVFEVARLLRKYPAFNAFYANGTGNYYEEINIGFAIDGEFGLKVPVVRKADTKGLIEIANEVQELLVQYLSDAVPLQALSGGTFTITDLSGEGAFTFNPVLNQGQSGILGLGGDVCSSGLKRDGFFSMVLGFDHQLAAGRQAVRFLNQLRDRVQSYELALGGSSGISQVREEPACSECLRPLGELRRLEAYLLPVVSSAQSEEFVCSFCLSGY